MTGLLDILDSPEYGEAAAYELLCFGKRPEQLGTDELTWYDLRRIIRFADERSPLSRALYPDVIWGLQEQLMAEAVDTLRWLKWAKTKAAQYGRDLPDPIPRPGVTTPEVIGGAPVDIDDIDALLGWSTQSAIATESR